MIEKQDPVFVRMSERLAPFNIRGLELTPSTHITTDLEIDSVAVLDLIMEIEDEYGVSFPMNSHFGDPYDRGSRPRHPPTGRKVSDGSL